MSFRRFFRSFVCVCILVLFGACAFVLNFFVFPIAKIVLSKKNYIFLSSDLIRFLWGKILLNLMVFTRLIKLNVKNLQKLTLIKNNIIVATHPSFIDIVILIGLIPRTSCIVKNELAENPLFSNIVKSFFITNDVDIEELKKESNFITNSGFNIVVFPAGSRHKNSDIPKLKKGAALIALNSEKDVVPVKIQTDGEFMFINKPFYDVDEKTVVFTLEVGDSLCVRDYANLSDIEAKKLLTADIAKSLYNK